MERSTIFYGKIHKVSALWVSPLSSVALAVPAIFDRGRLVFGLRTLRCLWFGVIQKTPTYSARYLAVV